MGWGLGLTSGHKRPTAQMDLPYMARLALHFTGNAARLRDMRCSELGDFVDTMEVRLPFPTRWPRRFEAVLSWTTGRVEQRQLEFLANGTSRVIYGDGVDVFKFEDLDSLWDKNRLEYEDGGELPLQLIAQPRGFMRYCRVFTRIVSVLVAPYQ